MSMIMMMMMMKKMMMMMMMMTVRMKIYIGLLVTASIGIGELAPSSFHLHQLSISTMWIFMILANNHGDNYLEDDNFDCHDQGHHHPHNNQELTTMKTTMMTTAMMTTAMMTTTTMTMTTTTMTTMMKSWVARGCESASEEQSMLRHRLLRLIILVW